MTAPVPDIYAKDHKKADLPGPGEEIANPKDETIVYYITNSQRMWGRKANVGKHPGLYVSKDGGKTWRLWCLSFEFQKLFVHPDRGRLFAIILYESLKTDAKEGTLEHYYSNKIIMSSDGKKWKDITRGQGYITGLYGIFRDPDNPSRVCLEACLLRPYVLQAKDDDYSDWSWLRMDRPEGERLLRSKPAVKE